MRLLKALFACILLTVPAFAGGEPGSYRSGFCYRVENAQQIISLGSKDDIRHELERRYDHALDVSMSRRAIYATSPLLTWANEAKITCAKALGYLLRWKLERPAINEHAIQQCECFYARMSVYNR